MEYLAIFTHLFSSKIFMNQAAKFGGPYIYGPQASRDSIRGKVIVVKSSKKIVLTKALPELPLKKAHASTNSTH